MWKQVLLFVLGVQSFQGCFAISQDESVRSYLEHFNTTRNNHVTPALKTAARDFIVKTFQDFGLDTWTEEFKSNQKDYPGINIVGRVNGRYTGTSKDKILIIAAHYDTEPRTNGVDDNGSGMTALLQALRQYKSSNDIKCSQNFTLLFVAFDLEEIQQFCQAPPCSCGGSLCGSGYFVANLTRHLDSLKATLQGAYVLETIMNYNTTPNSQELPTAVASFLPKTYNWVSSNQFRGDWLAVIGRKWNDSVLTDKFVSNFKQGAFKVLSVPLPLNGRPSDANPMTQQALSHFLRSDHARFWNSNHSWPAVFLTDTANFRGYMKTCYHEQCDNMDQVTPEMITFMGKTTDALVKAAQSLTGQVCPSRENCKNITIRGDKTTISSPSYPSEYPNGIQCSWLKESSAYNQMLQFEDLNLEESANCVNDFLEVSAGNTTQSMRVIGRFCGSTTPSTIRVSDKMVKVRFVSDALLSKKGFRIIWTEPPKPIPSSTPKKGVQCWSAFLAVLVNVIAVILI